MTDLWYFNTENVGQEDFNSLLKLLPQEMASEIMRFRNHTDRRLKLYGKLMVKKYYEKQNLEFDWFEWQLSTYGKPYRDGNRKFNISHSGNYVVVAFSDQEIGVDIEKLTDFDTTPILSYLHPSESKYIESASNQEAAFYKVWTRKESYLKAIGKGIIDGLNNENCLLDELTHKEKWYLKSLRLFSNYQLAICTQIPNCQINTRELLANEFQV